MQTFLPYDDFVASAAVLDDKRLGKQRVETYQILRALTWPTYGWKNHPATKMWRGFTPALVRYGLDVCDAWEARGRADATRVALLGFTGGRVPVFDELRENGQLPPWLGEEAVHVSHRSALLRKDPEYYRPFFPTEPDDLPYAWPAAAFPRWPLRRGRPGALPLVTALGLLGLEEATPEQASVIAALQDGDDATGTDPVTGLLAGLCTPGTTVWVSPDRPGMPGPAELPVPMVGKPGKVSVPVAKEPTPADAEAMATEAAAEPEYRFLAAKDLVVRDGDGLVVFDRVPPRPGLGVPVLALS